MYTFLIGFVSGLYFESNRKELVPEISSFIVGTVSGISRSAGLFTVSRYFF